MYRKVKLIGKAHIDYIDFSVLLRHRYRYWIKAIPNLKISKDNTITIKF
jgi:hypothetical protein